MNGTSASSPGPRASEAYEYLRDALVIPAEGEQPARRVDIRDGHELVGIIGGEIEAIACARHRDLRGFIDATGTSAGRPINDRAARVLCPGDPRRRSVAGEVVIVGFDTAARRVCRLSSEQEDRITGPGPIHHPDRVARVGHHRSYSWDLTSLQDASAVRATLSVGHQPAAAGAPGELQAHLVKETVPPLGTALEGTVEGDWSAAFCTERATTVTGKRLDAFAAHALETLRARFLLSDPEIHAAFRVPC